MDMGASVIARLKTKAKETGSPSSCIYSCSARKNFCGGWLPPVMRKTWCLRVASSFTR